MMPVPIHPILIFRCIINIMQHIHKKYHQLQQYLYPPTHRVNVHDSHINPNVLYYIRLCSCIYLTGIFLWQFTFTHTLLFDVIYLTLVGYYFSWLYFILVIQDHFLGVKPALRYYIEAIYEMAICLQISITIIFWTVLFPMLVDTDASPEDIALNTNLHAGPLICLLLDLVYNMYSFRTSHFLMVIVIGLIYMVINCVYSLQVKPIYDPIDWITFVSYALVIGAFILAFLMHWFCRWIFHKYKKKRKNRQSGLLEEQGKEEMNQQQQQQS